MCDPVFLNWTTIITLLSDGHGIEASKTAQVRVLILEAGHDSSTKLYRLEQGWTLSFQLGASLMGCTGVTLWTNYPASSDHCFKRSAYQQIDMDSETLGFYTLLFLLETKILTLKKLGQEHHDLCYYRRMWTKCRSASKLEWSVSFLLDFQVWPQTHFFSFSILKIHWFALKENKWHPVG